MPRSEKRRQAFRIASAIEEENLLRELLVYQIETERYTRKIYRNVQFTFWSRIVLGAFALVYILAVASTMRY